MTGQYVFVPDASAIDARLVDDADSFTVTASSLGITSTASYTIAISVPDTAPGTPTALAATPGPEQIALTWTAPVWLGGSAIEGYVIESSTDGVLWTTLTDTGTDATSYTATGLTNGDAVSFRFSARNATGTGPASTPVTATPVDVAVAPTDLVALPGNHRVDLTYGADGHRRHALHGVPDRVLHGRHDLDDGLADTGSTATAFTATGLANGIPVSSGQRAQRRRCGPGQLPTTARLAPSPTPR